MVGSGETHSIAFTQRLFWIRVDFQLAEAYEHESMHSSGYPILLKWY